MKSRVRNFMVKTRRVSKIWSVWHANLLTIEGLARFSLTAFQPQAQTAWRKCWHLTYLRLMSAISINIADNLTILPRLKFSHEMLSSPLGYEIHRRSWFHPSQQVAPKSHRRPSKFTESHKIFNVKDKNPLYQVSSSLTKTEGERVKTVHHYRSSSQRQHKTYSYIVLMSFRFD